jgi:Na+-transporting NADH:ubiquinone oxidoreductase subunit NqrC
MPALVVEISRFVDEHFPGFVECLLIDANGQSHIFIEKAPVVSAENLGTTSNYPCPGTIKCEIDAKLKNNAGLSIVRVNTIESTTGQTQFLVLPSQLVS